MNTERIQPVTQSPGVNAVFLILNIKHNDDALAAVKDFAGGFSAMVRSLSRRFPQSHFNALMGFGSDAWDRLFPQAAKPAQLRTFEAIRGAKHEAPSTPGDLFFHLRADTQDLCFEMASYIHSELQDFTETVDEVHGFRYLDGRAIIGFVDGTENPEDAEVREYAVVGSEDPEFAGGSYAFTQKYLHDMKLWRSLNTEAQEKVIGRRKYDDMELGDDEKPESAHNNIAKAHDADGNELKILRANVAFAEPSKNEYGTFFIGYARYFSTTQQMLEHMFAGNENGVSDRLLDFSTAVSGCLFFVPTYDFLDGLGDE